MRSSTLAVEDVGEDPDRWLVSRPTDPGICWRSSFSVSADGSEMIITPRPCARSTGGCSNDDHLNSQLERRSGRSRGSASSSSCGRSRAGLRRRAPGRRRGRRGRPRLGSEPRRWSRFDSIPSSRSDSSVGRRLTVWPPRGHPDAPPPSRSQLTTPRIPPSRAADRVVPRPVRSVRPVVLRSTPAATSRFPVVWAVRIECPWTRSVWAACPSCVTCDFLVPHRCDGGGWHVNRRDPG